MILRTGRRKLAEVSEKACKLHIVADHADNLIPFFSENAAIHWIRLALIDE
jgi:hypothetical protein